MVFESLKSVVICSRVVRYLDGLKMVLGGHLGGRLGGQILVQKKRKVFNRGSFRGSELCFTKGIRKSSNRKYVLK